MKTLSVRQPWASLICAGIKDIENRTWKPAHLPCRILIHASSYKMPKSWLASLPPFFGNSFLNYDEFGWIPPINQLPTSAIIGYVDVVGVTTDSDSMWAGEDCQQWQLANAHVFDEPILNVKGKLNLYEYDLDENNLPPAHVVNRILPQLEGDTLVITYTDPSMDESWEYLQTFKEGDDITFYDSEEMNAAYNDDDTIHALQSIRIQNESNTRFFHFEVTESCILQVEEDEETTRQYLSYQLGRKLQ